MATKPVNRPKGHRPKPTPKPAFDFSRWLDKILFSTTEQQAFLEDVATLVEDGVPANRAIDVIGRVEKGSKRKVADAISMKLAQGRAIADGMVGWFTPAVVELIRAGEQGGTLANNIRMAAESMGKKSATFTSLASSMTYPLIVMITACFVLVYLNHSIFPQFASIKPLSQWPANGQNLVRLANFVQDFGIIVVIGLTSIAVAIGISMRTVTGDLRRTLDPIFGFTIYRQLVAARFMETMGLLISNGIVFKQALKIMQQQASPYLSWHMLMMELRLGRGRANIAEVLDTGLISDSDIVRLKAIADAKGFEHALIRLGKAAGERGVKTVQKLGKIAGSLLLVVAASFAGYMVMGIYSVGSSLS